ncbi:tyrosine-type recombinase/integrase [Fusobacterium sp. PH5-44]|uniref:tyrosine-type recombinase/integrase n=1 Tax=unclassified Fusobacterium TaxID=2648384 RepID=UPI003D1F9D21
MEIKKINNNSISTNIRKKRTHFNEKKIFEIYKSNKTLADYQFYLKKFLNFVYEGNENFEINEIIPLMTSVESKDVDDYIVYLFEERSMKKSSVNKVLSGLKSLYKELENYGYTNPFAKIKLFKVTRNIDSVLKVSYSDIKKIIGLYKINNFSSFRNITLLHTLFYTGMRSNELLNLKFSHMLNRDGILYFKLVQTKSGVEQFKPIHKSLETKLKEYKEVYQTLHQISNDEIENYYIFSSKPETNQQLSYNSLYDIIEKMGLLINKSISPHNIRHAVATELSLNNADLLEIRDFLGHSNTKVTEIYIDAKNILEKRVLNKLPSLDDE